MALILSRHPLVALYATEFPCTPKRWLLAHPAISPSRNLAIFKSQQLPQNAAST
jgi:hypothetical protein